MELNLFKIRLEQILDDLSNGIKSAIIYADFNIINYLYESNIQLPPFLIVYPDSSAVYLALKYIYSIYDRKIVSTDLQEEILKAALKSNMSLFFFGDKFQVLEGLKIKLQVKYPGIQITGLLEGYDFNNIDVVQKINSSSPDILFVGLGASRQERWIIDNYKNINAKLIISVGGWFRYLSGNKIRAPLFIRTIHLEWLVKLLNEFPVVWKRYIFGIPKFYYRLFANKIILKI
ncbi:MAG: WecB/TagA/CpsF family glycosyltransferase [Ignavibacteriaceae bacterium]|nr:WecB/TagA/CpsF family glycosyltransferase [Ignavibacteriaceae bacterium]